MLIKLKYLIDTYNISINGILHIGAHNCEELNDYVSCGIDNRNIYWIEALPELVNKIKRENKDIQIFQGLVWEEDDKVFNFNITNNNGDKTNLQSSSILDFGTHQKHHPHIKIVRKVKLKSSRIDTLIDKYNIEINNINFINLDIQGVELQALKSMEQYLDKIDYIYTEVNTEEVYKNCSKMQDLTKYLEGFGFKLLDKYIFNEYGWGDAIYVREK